MTPRTTSQPVSLFGVMIRLLGAGMALGVTATCSDDGSGVEVGVTPEANKHSWERSCITDD